MVFVLLLQASTTLFAQDLKVTLNLENVLLKDVLREIETQTGNTFLYSNTKVDVNQKLSVNVQNLPLNQALDKVFKGTGITYRIEGKQIALSPQVSAGGDTQKPEKITVTGLVTDALTKETIPGVNIMVKGTTQGTVTDFDGNYRIEVNVIDPVLVFSYVGFVSQEVPIQGREVINVILEQESKRLDEVVVIGYGSESKRLLTGSIGAISTEGLQERPIQSIDNILQGQTAGVQITQNSGTPGAAMTVRIRGNSSINAGNQPLYVVDGVPILSGDFGQVGFSGQGTSALSDLNPNDIESISILRDASAAAIYGARASNGVVLITTKRGKTKDTKFSLNLYGGLQKPYQLLEMINAKQFLELRNEIDVNDGNSPRYTQAYIDTFKINTNWLDEVFRTAPISSVELSASNGGEKTSFYVSGSYFDQKGILLGTDYQRLSARLNVDHNVNDWFKIGSGMSFSSSLNNRVEGDQSLNGPLPNALSSLPISPIYLEDGVTYYEGDFFANPVAIAREAINEARSYRNIANVYAEARPISGMVIQSKLGYDYLNFAEHSYDPTTTRQGAGYNGVGLEAFSKATNLTSNTTLDYSKTIGEHNFGAMLGNSFEIYDNTRTYVRGQDFPSDALQYVGSAAIILRGSATATKSTLLSYFSRFKYNYKFKYLLTLNARFDGSSRFGKNNKFGFFPSLSAAWRISEEAFLKDYSWLSELKLRASTGVTGNDRIGNFAFLGLYGAGFNYGSASGIAPLQLSNPDLKWENTVENNFGLDFSILKERITFNVDYYIKNTTDLLLDQPIAPSSGFEYVTKNVGEMVNKGFEFNLTTVNLEGEVNWTTNINLSTNRNEVTKLYGDVDRIIDVARSNRGSNQIFIGQPIGVFYGYNWLGVDPSTGDCVYEDLDGDGEITSSDQMIIGNPHPDFVGGLSNAISYKGLSLNVLVQYTYGNDVFNGSRMWLEGLAGEDNQTTAVLRRWRQPGDITDVPRATTLGWTHNANLKSNRFIEDGSYFRIKNVNLSWELPKQWSSQLKVSNAKVYVSVQNLWTWSRYSGMDPDVNFAGASNLYMGTDFFTYPQARTITIGFSSNF
jgi:TonB-linked SusC/RagA family outer membrane protein